MTSRTSFLNIYLQSYAGGGGFSTPGEGPGTHLQLNVQRGGTNGRTTALQQLFFVIYFQLYAGGDGFSTPGGPGSHLQLNVQ